MGQVIYKDFSKQFLQKNERVIDRALERMADDIVFLAKSTVPFESGELFKAIEKRSISSTHKRILVDKEYAGYQERGKRYDGTHVVRQYTTPSTGKGFLFNAGEKVKSDALNYLKQAVHSMYNQI